MKESRRAVILLIGLFLAACGGSPSGPAMQQQQPNAQPPTGIFVGTYTIGNNTSPYDVLAAISQGAGISLWDNDDFTTLPSFGATSANGNASVTHACYCGILPGQMPMSATASGGTISGTFTDSVLETGLGMSGQFSLSQVQVETIASSLAGTYEGFSSGSPPPQATWNPQIDSSGDAAGTFGDCNISGTIALGAVPQFGRVALSSTPTSNTCFGSASGLAFIASQDFLGIGVRGLPASAYLYLMVYNSEFGVAIELIRQ